MNIANNKMKALASRVSTAFGLTGMLMEGSEDDESADKIFVSFLLVEIAKENGLLKDNCNRAVAAALHAIGMEEEKTPRYLKERSAS